MKESESGESSYERAHESERAESVPAVSGHAPAVRKEIASHKSGHVSFPTLGSSHPGTE